VQEETNEPRTGGKVIRWWSKTYTAQQEFSAIQQASSIINGQPTIIRRVYPVHQSDFMRTEWKVCRSAQWELGLRKYFPLRDPNADGEIDTRAILKVRNDVRRVCASSPAIPMASTGMLLARTFANRLFKNVMWLEPTTSWKRLRRLQLGR
jgi:hypothetical protein